MTDNDRDPLEDVVRAAMRAHEHEAPSAAEFRTHRPAGVKHSRARWIAPLAAAACILALVGVLVAIERPGTSRSPAAGGPSDVPSPTGWTEPSPLSCPPQYNRPNPPQQYWVPQQPKGVKAGAQLVPDGGPISAVVCAYLHDDNGKRTGSRNLAGDLSAIPSSLMWLPREIPGQSRPCLLYSTPTDGDDYLIGLRFPEATIWVSVPGNHCAGSSNGVFDSTVNLRAEAAQAYASGTWVPAAAASADGCPYLPGRVGQDEQMVPGEPESVQICPYSAKNGDGTYAGGPHLTGDPLTNLAAALNALPTSPQSAGWSCTEARLRQDAFIAMFRYADGPPVRVEVHPYCGPRVMNGTLQSASAESVLPLIKDLLPQK